MGGKEGSLGVQNTKTISQGTSQDFLMLVGQESSPQLEEGTKKEDMESSRQRQTLTSLRNCLSTAVSTFTEASASVRGT